MVRRMGDKLVRTDEEWKKLLTPEQYKILRKRGTEKPFTGALLHNKEEGTYRCAGCGNTLFLSKDKFDSGSGWPSFTSAIPGSLEFLPDKSYGQERIEVRCSRYGGHLGDVFDYGPQPTRNKYCINSAGISVQEEK